MAKYRKKPIIIEAEQYLLSGEQIEGVCYKLHGSGMKAHIHTLEGIMKVNLGDFVIKGIQGEVYPRKSDIFKATYEKVE